MHSGVAVVVGVWYEFWRSGGVGKGGFYTADDATRRIRRRMFWWA